MRYRTIEIEDTDYQHLEKAAKSAGIPIQLFLKQLIAQQLGGNGGSRNGNMAKQANRQKGRWAQFSERIQKNPPLRGAGGDVRKCSEEFKEDFALKVDEE